MRVALSHGGTRWRATRTSLKGRRPIGEAAMNPDLDEPVRIGEICGIGGLNSFFRSV